MKDQNAPLSVIIIGGAVSGLTLAHCMEAAGIDYVVLEKHNDICTNIGGSLALQPHGARVLDQLGLFEQLEKLTNNITKFHTCNYDDTHTSLFPTWTMESLGYPMTVLRRTNFLRTVYSALKDQSRIKTGTKVVRIRANSTVDAPLIVETEDGTQYTGDVIVGADGVHSITRSEMWRIANEQQPGLITEEEKRRMTVDYMCIFGISTPSRSLFPPGEQVNRFQKDVAVFILQGHDGTVSWFMNIKLDKRYVMPHVPSWSNEETRARGEKLAGLHLSDGVYFRDVWESAETISSTPVYEGMFQVRTCGRIACIGDSSFKVSPDLAHGANLAIESAAAISNTLHRINMNINTLNRRPTNADVEEGLVEWARSCQYRLAETNIYSRFVTKAGVHYSFIHRVLHRAAMQYTLDVQFHRYMTILNKGRTLDFLPFPDRGRDAWEKYKGAGAMRTVCAAAFFPVGLILSICSVFREVVFFPSKEQKKALM
ncbi:uncharacterized protein TRUGW13939_08990 [Talaromyces rugulosus]|uniref:FAD-binding domain-containing protein n=1 Tax=Talaromyces rugulosus TaxID=121627 RepID=A0A7H8R627_TALRU|nr:uncharacterized protein TRUGW13939_08990 [Talaromyces rugulosus]QKX61834.1 hypothetical protein TRUGW13939_08990 [Talaromyces rugulosus]